jgi:hypothetical protein
LEHSISIYAYTYILSASAGILPKGNVVDLVDEIRTNRTNSVWRIGRVEYTSLAENFVFLCDFVVKKSVSISAICGKKTAKPA